MAPGTVKRTIPLVVSTSTGSSCSLPLVKAGTTNFALLNATLSCMVKPQSAVTISPGTNLLKIPQFSVKNLSEVRPPHASEANVILPCGVMPIKTLMVLWCLQELNVCALASKFVGFSIKISKQSIITVVLVPKLNWKHCGIDLIKLSRSGQCP